MKNIAQNGKRNFQNLQNKQTVKRINKITKSFRSANPNQKEKMLKTLASEINQTENNAVKNWLIRFDSTLRAIGGIK